MTAYNTLAEVIEAVNATQGVVVDDHTGSGTREVYGVATLVRGDQLIPISLHLVKYFSLNSLYLAEDGKVHISTMSCGGCVEVFDRTMEDAINKYNEDQSTNMFTASFLTDVYLLVDGKLEAMDWVTSDDVTKLQAKAQQAREDWDNAHKSDTYRASE